MCAVAPRSERREAHRAPLSEGINRAENSHLLYHDETSDNSRMPKKVLLIDYEPRSVERVRSLLPDPEYVVVEARDGEEGLNAFSGSRFDAVIVAGMLPRLSSAEVIREIRRKGGATAPPILLMVSGYKGSNRKADAQRVGAFDLLARPFSDEEFRETVAAAIDSADLGAKTLRIQKDDAAGSGPGLTSSDIFSDVLEEVGGEFASAAPAAPPAPVVPGRSAAAATEQEVERRLRNSLSGILPDRPAPRAGTAAASASPVGGTGPAAPDRAIPAPPRFSTVADIDRMLNETLSGLKVRVRPRPSAGPPLRGVSPESAPITEKVEVPPPAVSAPGPDRFGQYEILERIASGGMAELFKARRSGVEGFQKIVAIKKILPHLADNEEFIAMFADEAKLAAQLNHPNIVHIFDLGKIESGGYFIAMEYVDGRDLRAILHSAREVGIPLPIPLAVYIASKVAAALDYAHRRREADGHELKIVHRDVSPQNILISYEGDIKLCDFGIAKAASKASQTQSGALKGKVRYMSPEQAWGRAIDRRSDLFSLGCVLYEMLTNQVLFRGDTDLNVLEKVRAAEVMPPSSVNPDVGKNLDAIVLKALAGEPEARYANASEMLRDLEAVLYAHTPAPGSADLAIYLHRLQVEESARQESRVRVAARAAAPEPELKKKSKGTAVVRRGGSAPIPAAPAPEAPALNPPALPAGASPRREAPAAGVFGASPSRRAEAERRSRTPLYGMIAAAGLLLIGVVWWAIRKPAAPRATLAQAAPVVTGPASSAATSEQGVVTPLPAVASAGANPRSIEEEVQKQLAAKKKELQKSLEATAKPAREVTARKAEVTKSPELTAPPAVAAAEPSPVKLEPTAPPLVAEAPPPLAPPRESEVREPEVARGELAGPGPGVVEPTLVSPPRVAYPPIARQQRVTGRVVVLVFVDEEGAVLDARLQQGIASKTGVNEAVVEGVRHSRFRPATKNGVPVKMWRTLVVDVKP